MTLDGYEVVVGDRVYDLAMGHGVVESIANDQITVWYNTHGYPYDSRGHGPFRQRTLYWANPIQTVPSKDPGVRDLAGKLYNAVNQVLKDHRP